MKKRPTWFLFSSAFLLISRAVQADMVETKDEGFVNGEIVSEDENSIEFKDARGVTRHLEKKDLPHIEREAKAKHDNLSFVKQAGNKIRSAGSGLAKSLPKNWTIDVEKLKEKNRLDRSVVDNEMKAIVSIAQQANEAQSAAFLQQKRVAEEMRQVNQERNGSADSSGSKKGRFRSLSDG